MNRIVVFEKDPVVRGLLRARLAADPRIDVVAEPPAALDPARDARRIVIGRGVGDAEYARTVGGFVAPSRLIMVETQARSGYEHKRLLAFLHAVDCLVASLLYPVVPVTATATGCHGPAFPIVLSEPVRFIGECDGARHYAVRDRLSGAIEHLVEGPGGCAAIEAACRAFARRGPGEGPTWRQEIVGDRCFVVGGKPPAGLALPKVA